MIKINYKNTTHIIIAASILALTCFITSCQPTPEKEVVVSKSEGQLEQIIQSTTVNKIETEIENKIDGEIQSKIDEQKIWETSLHKGKVNVTIYAQIITPDVQVHPILSIIPTIMNQELAEKALEVFFKGAIPYDRGLTKQMIEARLLNINRIMEQIQSGNATGGFEERDYDRLNGEKQVLLELYETALDEKELLVADTTLIEEHKGQFMRKSIELYGKVNKPCYADLIVMNIDSINFNIIEFRNYDNNNIIAVGSTTEYIKDSQLNGVSITLEEAQQLADDTIADMGITGIELIDVKTGNLFEVKPKYTLEDIESDKQIYQLVYAKTYNEIYVHSFNSVMMIRQDESDPDPVPYSAVLEAEKLIIEVDDSGVVGFNWKNPTTSNGIISENVDLLDFEKIKEIFSDQIFYHHFYNGSEGSMEIGIDKIVLSYFIQPVKDDNNKYITLPVWDFVRSNAFNGNDITYLTINAIDGSVINRDIGY